MNIVEYHNDINKIPLRKLSEKEINLFFSIIFKAKNEKSNSIKISFKELKKLSNGDVHSKRFLQNLESLNLKLLKIDQKIELPNGDILMFNLFNDFLISKERKVIEVNINKKFQYMLNDLLKNYTRLELEYLVQFKSSYSKNIFRLLKQFQSTQFFVIDLEEFRRILCIPESYRIAEIDKRVLKISLKELEIVFPNLKLEKIKEGRKVKSLKFTWFKNKNLNNDISTVNKEVKISKALADYIEILKNKNRYISPYLTPANIEILLKEWSNERLIKGLKFARNQIQKEFLSLNYLKKAIKTGIEASEKFFAIEDDKKEEKTRVKKNDPEIKVKNDPLVDIKGDIAKWCMKNAKYKLFSELEEIKTLSEVGVFLEKYNIVIV